MSVRNANIVFGGTAEELGVWNFEFGIVRQGALRSVILQMSLQFIGEFAAVGRALTKTFLHSPLMGANPFICAQHAPIIGKTDKNTRI